MVRKALFIDTFVTCTRSVCVCACVRVCVRACVRACVSECVRACVGKWEVRLKHW